MGKQIIFFEKMNNDIVNRSRLLVVYLIAAVIIGRLSFLTDWYMRIHILGQFTAADMGFYKTTAALISGIIGCSTFLLNIAYCIMAYRFSRKYAWAFIALFMGNTGVIVFLAHRLFIRNERTKDIGSEAYRLPLWLGISVVIIHVMALIPNPLLINNVAGLLGIPYQQEMFSAQMAGYIGEWVSQIPAIGFGVTVYIMTKEPLHIRLFWGIAAFIAPVGAVLLRLMIKLSLKREMIHAAADN